MSVVLVINSGSSSFKYQLVDTDSGSALASGLVERIGQDEGRAVHVDASGAESERTLPIPDHTAGFQAMLDAFGAHGPSLRDVRAVASGQRAAKAQPTIGRVSSGTMPGISCSRAASVSSRGIAAIRPRV